MVSLPVSFQNASNMISKQKEIIKEMNSIFNYIKTSTSNEEKEMVSSQIVALNNYLRNTGQQALKSIEKLSLFKPLKPKPINIVPLEPKKTPVSTPQRRPVKRVTPTTSTQEHLEKIKKRKGNVKFEVDELENLTLERLKKTEKKTKGKKEKKPSLYIKLANKLFHKKSVSLLEKGYFKNLERDLVKANMEFVPAAYVSVIFLTALISVIVAIFATIFFLFFSLTVAPPFIVRAEGELLSRFLKVFWILFIVPSGTLVFTYFYPNLERMSIEDKINVELPFAVIHMSSISNSMIEPSKIFAIISSTKEYPYLEKEFTKLQNEINVYGYDLVTALKNRSLNSPSRRLAELMNGLSTTITSGGDLPGFFEKRAQTLLFDHKLEREKQAKANETFMDIYISVVIAAPMILMLLLMMMRISGIGVSLSTALITLIMILGVTVVNIFFLTFLHLKRQD